ncbi:hypothetical protein C8F04DRAFT_1406461 [Mycena alexandri]|uniref:Uncharacterized protein n=1 Tax=Mycena alexandri TaxID=1745969 RepID=A0AAD6RX27_9AGAR|nr:hypothetical protein C8F04DRAFT_1406461 [Mycena alexandri]
MASISAPADRCGSVVSDSTEVFPALVLPPACPRPPRPASKFGPLTCTRPPRPFRLPLSPSRPSAPTPAVVMPLAANSRLANPAHILPLLLAARLRLPPPSAVTRQVATLARCFCGPFPAASALRPRRQPLSPLRHPVLRSPHLTSHTRPIHAGPSPAPFTPRTKAFVEGNVGKGMARNAVCTFIAPHFPHPFPHHHLFVLICVPDALRHPSSARSLPPLRARCSRSRAGCDASLDVFTACSSLSPLRVLGREFPLTTLPCAFPFIPPHPASLFYRLHDEQDGYATRAGVYANAQRRACEGRGWVRRRRRRRALAPRLRHRKGAYEPSSDSMYAGPHVWRAGGAYGSYSAFGSAVLRGSGT